MYISIVTKPRAMNVYIRLILYEMGMEDKDVRRIMGITQEAIRSTRYRIQQGGKKNNHCWKTRSTCWSARRKNWTLK